MKRPLRLLLVEDMEDHALLLVRELGKGFEVAFDRVDTLQAGHALGQGVRIDAHRGPS